ncbi:MAG: hypothetical protein GZ089_07020 [Aromatoleum sp.]|nr:hypothetical protein [Aromatoleum sp.]
MPAVPSVSNSAAADADPVLIGNATAQVRRSDYLLELQRMPAEARGGFGNNKRRIEELLARLLLTKTLAAQAFAQKLDQDPEVQARLKGELERFYAGARQVALERASLAEFEARKASLEPRARELYAVNMKRFEVPEQVSASHILIATDKHSKGDALKLAQDTRARIVAGENFNTIAAAVSEDASTKPKKGRLGFFSRDEMDPGFSDAAFALKNVGDVSEPALSRFGWHLIQLEGRKASRQPPYTEVREVIFAEMRQKYVDERRDALLASINNDPTTKIDEAALEALFIAGTKVPGVTRPVKD